MVMTEQPLLSNQAKEFYIPTQSSFLHEFQQVTHNTHRSDRSSSSGTLHYQRPRAVTFCMEHDDVI
jgi:hypothetical protein